MKILKIFGIVVGIHVFALILIFANPGCSSTTKQAPAPSDTVLKTAAPAPVVSVPSASPGVYSSTTDSFTSAPPVTFNADAPASAGVSAGSRITPTRPGTPVAGVLVSEPVTGVEPATTYTVKTGDSLWTIARKNNMTVAQLTAVNELPANANLKPGQKLKIPSKSGTTSTPAVASTGGATATKSAAEAPAASARTNSEGIKHTVKAGETLGAIARTYGVRQGDIAVANNISDPAKIKPGMELMIPGWTPKNGKSGKASTKTGSTAAKSTPPPAAPAAEPIPVVTPPPASTLPPVPIIRLDDAPISPAPKQP